MGYLPYQLVQDFFHQQYVMLVPPEGYIFQPLGPEVVFVLRWVGRGGPFCRPVGGDFSQAILCLGAGEVGSDTRASPKTGGPWLFFRGQKKGDEILLFVVGLLYCNYIHHFLKGIPFLQSQDEKLPPSDG